MMKEMTGMKRGREKIQNNKKIVDLGGGGEMAMFGQHIRDADRARVELEHEHLTFKKERYEKGKQEFHFDCEERNE